MQARHAEHTQVEHQHVRTLAVNMLNGAGQVVGDRLDVRVGDYLDVLLGLEQPSQAAAHRGVIVGHGDPDRVSCQRRRHVRRDTGSQLQVSRHALTLRARGRRVERGKPLHVVGKHGRTPGHSRVRLGRRPGGLRLSGLLRRFRRDVRENPGC